MIGFWFVAIVAAQAAVQPSGSVDVSDERVLQLGGQDSLLISYLGDRFYKQDSDRLALMRLGLEQGCPLYHWAVNVAVTKSRVQFRPALIAAMRKTVPPEYMAEPRLQTGLWGPLARYRPTVEAELHATAPKVFATLERDFRIAWDLSSRAMPAAAPGAAESVFGDWDLNRPLALQGACMLIGRGGADAETLRQRKAVFDQFFKKGAN